MTDAKKVMVPRERRSNMEIIVMSLKPIEKRTADFIVAASLH
jgi:hypothetical protein